MLHALYDEKARLRHYVSSLTCQSLQQKSPGAVPMAALRGGRRGSHRESPPALGAPSVYLRRAQGLERVKDTET